jgi:hypothetical protein
MDTIPGSQRFRITKENAREMAAKAWAARRAKAKTLQEQAQAGRNATPQSERLANQIAQIELLMDGEKDADTLSKLSTAHARLFTAWQVLTGTPNPGSRRSRSQRTQASEPLEPLPQPALVN